MLQSLLRVGFIHSTIYLTKNVLRAYTVCQTTLGVGIVRDQKTEKISAPTELFFFFLGN